MNLYVDSITLCTYVVEFKRGEMKRYDERCKHPSFLDMNVSDINLTLTIIGLVVVNDKTDNPCI